jgi:hypothetical protein
MSATFAAQAGQAGQVVKVADNGTVAPCADGEVFCGVMEGIRKGFTAVQLHGFVTLPYTGQAPELGYNTFAADANGGIKTAQEGRKCLVVSVDTNAMAVTIEL